MQNNKRVDAVLCRSSAAVKTLNEQTVTMVTRNQDARASFHMTHKLVDLLYDFYLRLATRKKGYFQTLTILQ